MSRQEFPQFQHGPGDMRDKAYLLHLDPPYKHASHYLGSADDLQTRLPQHGTSEGARLLQVQKQAGGSWHLVRTWNGGRAKEAQLKRDKDGRRFCPECTEYPRPGMRRNQRQSDREPGE